MPDPDTAALVEQARKRADAPDFGRTSDADLLATLAERLETAERETAKWRERAEFYGALSDARILFGQCAYCEAEA